MALLELAKIERTAIDEIELGTRHTRRFGHRLERGPVLLRELEDQIAPALDLGQPRWIEVDAARVLVELARELLERVERAVVELLQPRERRIDALNRRERSLHVREARQHGAFFPLESSRHPLRERLELLGMLETARLLLERDVLARLELRLVDLTHRDAADSPRGARHPLCAR